MNVVRDNMCMWSIYCIIVTKQQKKKIHKYTENVASISILYRETQLLIDNTQCLFLEVY